jgi:hypothetical protein
MSAAPCRQKDPVLLTARKLAASLRTGPGTTVRVAGGKGVLSQRVTPSSRAQAATAVATASATRRSSGLGTT